MYGNSKAQYRLFCACLLGIIKPILEDKQKSSVAGGQQKNAVFGTLLLYNM